MLRLVVTLLVLTLARCETKPQKISTGAKTRLGHVRDIWKTRRSLNQADIQRLREKSWEMFDFGFSNYMQHAFPKDNLLPVSCKGQDWQGGMALTLIDALDGLLLMNRRGDMEEAVDKLRLVINFDKDVKVHVFETTIRVLGGLLSAHVLLDRDRSLVPEYDGLFLRQAQDLADRMLPAFDTRTGLPGPFVHLQQGKIPKEGNVTCTACAGTLLIEFGLLSKLTGNNTYLAKADAAAEVLFKSRSTLGLVGSAIHVDAGGWQQKESTIGPGVDSYYEYLLKAYLMFGEQRYLDMFVELYVSTMRHMQVPGTLGNFKTSFLADVHMENGRLVRPFVSSLGAFWPAMQVLAGQLEEARELHANYTAAWRAFGWIPEMFSLDLRGISPHDPGYNLRPEHIESTFYLSAVTKDPQYLQLAADIMAVIEQSRTQCGYTQVADILTAELYDLQESYFLSETVKYLYLIFSPKADLLLDHWVLSTEGHVIPTFPHPNDPEEDPGWSKLDQDGGKGCSSRSTRNVRDGLLAPQKQGCSSKSSSRNTSNDAGDCKGLEGESATAAVATSARGTTRQSTTTVRSSNSSSKLTGRLSSQQKAAVPEQCKWVCQRKSQKEEEQDLAELLHSFPLIVSKTLDARRMRQRRCTVCTALMRQLAKEPATTFAARTSRLTFGTKGGSDGSSGTEGLMEWPGATILSQAVCQVEVRPNQQVGCKKLALLQPMDAFVGLGDGALLLQLSHAPPAATAKQALLVSIEAEGGPSTIAISAAGAQFGGVPPVVGGKCIDAMLLPTLRLGHQPLCPVEVFPGSAGRGQAGMLSKGVLRSGVASSREHGGTAGRGKVKAHQATEAAATAGAAGAGELEAQAAAPAMMAGEPQPTAATAVGARNEGMAAEGAAAAEALRAHAEPEELSPEQVRPLWSHPSPSLAACDATAARELLSILRHKTGRLLQRRQQLELRLRQAQQQGQKEQEQQWQQQEAEQQQRAQQQGGPSVQQERGAELLEQKGDLLQGGPIEGVSRKHGTDGEPSWKAWSFERLKRKQQKREQQQEQEQWLHWQQQQQAEAGSVWRKMAKEVLQEVVWPEVRLPAGCLGLDARGYGRAMGGPHTSGRDVGQREGPGTWLPAAAVHEPGHACYGVGDLPAGPLVPAQPLDGCEAPRNAAILQGTVAFVKRGSCSFVQKVKNMQAAGAIAVVVGNNQGGQQLMGMVGDGQEDQMLNIPAVLITKEDADALLWWVGRRAVVTTLVQKSEEEGGELPLGLFGGLREGPGPWMQGAVPWGKELQQQQQREPLQVHVAGKKSVVLGQGAKWGKFRITKVARTLEELKETTGRQEGSSSGSASGRPEAVVHGAVSAVVQHLSLGKRLEGQGGQLQQQHHVDQGQHEQEGQAPARMEQQQQQEEQQQEAEEAWVIPELASAPELWHAVQQELLERLKQQNSHLKAAAQNSQENETIAGFKVSELQVDLFVPAQSQAWLQEHVLKKGILAGHVHQTLVSDQQVLRMLTRGAEASRKAGYNVKQKAAHKRKQGIGKDGGH